MYKKLGLFLHNNTRPPQVPWVTLLGGVNEKVPLYPGTKAVCRLYQSKPFLQPVGITVGNLVRLYDSGFPNLCAGNEPNNPAEWGMNTIAKNQIWEARWWLREVYKQVKLWRPQAVLHMPALSPDAPGYADNEANMGWAYDVLLGKEPEGDGVPYDVLNVHAYWPLGRWEQGKRLVELALWKAGDKPVYVSEAGPMPHPGMPPGRHHRDKLAGEEMRRFLEWCEGQERVLGVAFWLWDTDNPSFRADILKGSEAWNILSPGAQPAYPSFFLGIDSPPILISLEEIIDLRRTLPQSEGQLKLIRPLVKVNKIVVHHSASRVPKDPDDDIQLIKAIHRYHQKWGGIRYHFAIGHRVYWTGDLELALGHTDNPIANTSSIGVCLLGDFKDKEPTLLPQKPEELGQLLATLKRLIGHPLKIVPHRDITQTTCPGRVTWEWKDGG